MTRILLLLALMLNLASCSNVDVTRYADQQPALSMDDWMYLMDEDTLINRTSMSKFGVEVGQVTLFFRRQGTEASQ